MALDSSYRLNALKDSTSNLDRATARVALVWNDRVSDAIDAHYINRIIDTCQSAISDIDIHVSQAESLYQHLSSLGR